MLEDVTGDVLSNLAKYTSQGDRPIVAWFVLLSFLEYGSYVGHPPVLFLCQGSSGKLILGKMQSRVPIS